MFTPHPHDELGRNSRPNAGSVGLVLQLARDLEALELREVAESRGWRSCFISKLYRQMYANTGISTDSARRQTANRWARWLAKPCPPLFQAKPMPDLMVPGSGRSPLAILQ